MEDEGKKTEMSEKKIENDMSDFEAKMEKELVTLIANIIVDKTLKYAGEKGHSISKI
jgi:hypothetical protein